MKSNEGLSDRMLRIYLGMVIAGIGIFYNSIWAVVGIPVFVSGVAGICPLYLAFGLNSISKAETE